MLIKNTLKGCLLFLLILGTTVQAVAQEHELPETSVVEHRFDYSRWYQIAADTIGVTVDELQNVGANRSVCQIARANRVRSSRVIKAIYKAEEQAVQHYIERGLISQEEWDAQARMVRRLIRSFVRQHPSKLVTTTESTQALWQSWDITDYQYEMRQICFCIGQLAYEITVQDSSVSDTVFIGTVPDGTDEPFVTAAKWTFDDHFMNIAESEGNTPAHLTAIYDPLFGYPISYAIDQSALIADEEVTYKFSEFSPISPSSPHDNALVALATADLAQTLAIDPADIRLVGVEDAVWDDTSMGCAAIGKLYLPMETAGYKITLSTGGGDYVYHTDSVDQLIACADDTIEPTTAWQITYNELEQVLPADPAYLMLKDGIVTVDIGCNQYQGTYIATPENELMQLDFSELALTDQQCEDSVTTSEAENALIHVLGYVRDITNEPWPVNYPDMTEVDERASLIVYARDPFQIYIEPTMIDGVPLEPVPCPSEYYEEGSICSWTRAIE